MSRRLWAVVLLVGPLDVGLTLPFWHLEGNPVVLELGKGGFIAVKVVALLGLLWVAQQETITETRTYNMGLWFLLVLYVLVVGTNLLTLLA